MRTFYKWIFRNGKKCTKKGAEIAFVFFLPCVDH